MTSPREICDAIKARIEALTWTAASGAERPAFGAVSLHSVADLDSALGFMVTAETRVAVIVWTGETWERQPSGTQGANRRSHAITVLVSDCVPGDIVAAAYGDDQNPGAIGLKDLVIDAVSGRLAELDDPSECVPDSATLASVVEEPSQRTICEITLRVLDDWLVFN